MFRDVRFEGIIPAEEATSFFAQHFVLPIQWTEEMNGLHSHPQYEMYLELTGGTTFLYKNHLYLLSRGDLLFLPKNEVHCCITYDITPQEHIGILFEENILGGDFNYYFSDPNRRYYSPSEADRKEIIDICFSLTQKHLPGVERRYLFLHLLHLLKRAEREPVEPSKNLPKNIAAMLLYVESHLHEPFTVAEMAKELYLSQSSIERQFKDFLHLTPLAYVNKRKMQTAANLLLDGMSVADTALAVGFNNVSHFILLFERHYGTTPHRYKKSSK